MNQAELNRQVAKQLGETVSEIARRGFTLLTEVRNDTEQGQQHERTPSADANAA